MWLVGTSAGVMNPVMPFLVEALQLSASEYGYQHSRRHICCTTRMETVHGGIVSLDCHGRDWNGMGGNGMKGMGVAALSTAGTLLVSDVSTPPHLLCSLFRVCSFVVSILLNINQTINKNEHDAMNDFIDYKC
jgi:hypothetical protein